jgi:hypothetical protein
LRLRFDQAAAATIKTPPHLNNHPLYKLQTSPPDPPGVCTHIIWLTQNTLTYYTGNYDTFRKTVAENEVVQLKKFQKEQDDIKVGSSRWLGVHTGDWIGLGCVGFNVAGRHQGHSPR